MKAVRVIVSRRETEHSSASLAEPDLPTICAVFSGLFARLGCESSGREVTAVAIYSEGSAERAIRFYAEDPEASAEEVAQELWRRICPGLR